MIVGLINSKQPIYKLLSNALTDDINNQNLFIKGIDYSYYYEGIKNKIFFEKNFVCNYLIWTKFLGRILHFYFLY